MDKKLFFFTSSFPYGIGEMWKTTELKHFIHLFEEVVLLPFNYGGNKTPKPIPAEVSLEEPVIKDFSGFKKHLIKIVFSKRLSFYSREFFINKVYLRKSWIRSWITAAIYVELLFENPIIRRLVYDNEYGHNSVLYFFWGRDSAYIVPFLKKDKFNKIAVRFHGFDLYEERKDNDGYIPFRRQLLKNITDALFISQNGLEYINTRYPQYRFSKHLFRLGAIGKGLAKPSSDGIFRIYTCSMLVPVKRLHLLAMALKLCRFNVNWYHIGDGPEKQKILELVEDFPENINCYLKGFIQPEKVVFQYVQNSVDLFINVSESEGVPVSIMEALSAGIPVMATDVGGTHEIVNQEIGLLLHKDISPQILADEIFNFYNLADREKLLKRESAYRYYKQLWDAEENAKRISAFLST